MIDLKGLSHNTYAFLILGEEALTLGDCKGMFDEISIYDDYDGVLHCTKCGIRVKRYFDESATIS